MVKRLIEILRWVPTAPTNITNKCPDGSHCNYCRATLGGLFSFDKDFCICQKCVKKIADTVLQPPANNGEGGQ